jgi:hypothetical protein
MSNIPPNQLFSSLPDTFFTDIYHEGKYGPEKIFPCYHELFKYVVSIDIPDNDIVSFQLFDFLNFAYIKRLHGLESEERNMEYKELAFYIGKWSWKKCIIITDATTKKEVSYAREECPIVILYGAKKWLSEFLVRYIKLLIWKINI